MNRSVYPWAPWIAWVVIGPLTLMVAAVAVWALTPLGDLPFDGWGYAWLLVVPVGGSALAVLTMLRRRRLATGFADRLVAALSSRMAPGRPAIRTGLQVFGLFMIVLAILGPRWGRGTEKLEGYGLDIVVAVDVSRSMLARDVVPDRLGRAQQEIERLALNPANRLGLLAFAGSASMKAPLTLDHAFFLQAVRELSPDSAPRGGTAIAEAILTAGDFFAASAEGTTRVVLVLTDGEDHEGDPVRAAKEIREEYGAITFAVGVGDPENPAGAQVPEGPGSSEPLVHDGQIVFSKLNLDALAAIAASGGGQAVPVKSFKSVVDRINQLEKRKLESEERTRYQPRYQVFLTAGLAALALQSLIRLRPRRREDRLERLTSSA